MKFLLGVSAVFAFSLVAQHGEMSLIKDKSTIGFVSHAKMLGVRSEVKGSFKNFSIDAYKSPNLNKSSIKVTIDVNSIDTDNSRRDRHLRSKEFFDEKKFKHILFKSKNITKVKGDTYRVNGDLTIKGKVINITFNVKAVEDKTKKRWRVTGEKVLNRNKAGITYVSPFYLPDVEKDIKAVFDVYLTYDDDTPKSPAKKQSKKR